MNKTTKKFSITLLSIFLLTLILGIFLQRHAMAGRNQSKFIGDNQ
jgi:hypothetical protein